MSYDSCLPGILTAYDGKKGNVRPLIDIRMIDGSYLPFPEVHDVPVITPATAFSGLKLPVKVGDKVVLHVADRDIQTLLFDKDTWGLRDPENALPPTDRMHNITDAIAYTGFQSLDDMIPSDNDVWIFNNKTDAYANEQAIITALPTAAAGDFVFNDDTGTVWNWSSASEAWEDSNRTSSYNHVRIKGDGSIELKTNLVTVDLSQNGAVSITAPANVTITAPTSTFNGNVVVTGTVDATGTITSAVDCVSAGISGATHTHIGNQGNPTSGPQ